MRAREREGVIGKKEGTEGGEAAGMCPGGNINFGVTV